MKAQKSRSCIFLAVTAVGMSLLVSNPLIAAPTLDGLMPMYVGMANSLGGVQVCGNKNVAVVRQQDMRLIKESGLTLADQNEMVRVFNLSYDDAVDYYTKTPIARDC